MNSNFGNGDSSASSSGSSGSSTTGASKSSSDTKNDAKHDTKNDTKHDTKNDTRSEGRSAGGSAANATNATSGTSALGATGRAPSDASHGVDIKKYLDDAKSMGKSLESQMSTRPYVALGAVAGVSFVAGSLLGSRIGQLAVAIGVGYAATHFLGTDVKALARKAASDF